MSAPDRQRVERYLDADEELRSAVYGLHLLCDPMHASILLGMAIRAGF